MLIHQYSIDITYYNGDGSVAKTGKGSAVCWESRNTRLDLPDPRKNAGPPLCTAGTNPINISTGNKYETATDYRSPGKNVFEFKRHYNSLSYGTDLSLGSHWSSTIDRRVVTIEAQFIEQNRPNGKTLYYWEFNNTITPRDNDHEGGVLAKTATGWRYLARDEIIEVYGLSDRIESITSKTGYTETYNYNAANVLESIADSLGQTLAFGYNSTGKISSVTTPFATVMVKYFARGNKE